MNWTIYSIGDPAFLFQVLQGIAALCGSNAWWSAAYVGGTAGALVVGIRSFQGNAQFFDFKEILGAMLIFYGLFHTTVTVTIISWVPGPTNGNAYVQANVPIGIAAPSAILSNLGMQLTTVFDQAFAEPDMTQTGFQGALETIKRVRINTISENGIGPANSPVTGSDFYTSWMNYVVECTISGLYIGRVTPTALQNTAPLMPALKFSSVINRTAIYVGGGETNQDCSDAYDTLAAFSTGTVLPALEAQMAAMLGGTANSAASTQDIVQTALNAIGMNNVTADDFIMTSVLTQIVFQAMAQNAAQDYIWSYAIGMSDATRNRASQWLGQSSLFTAYMQPMLAFLEGFQFAVMPIVFILSLFGFGAITLIARMFLGLIWIQLWYPLLAIVNLYEYMSLNGGMAAMTGAGTALTSLSGTLQADNTFLSWIAIGGYMASSVPLLSAGIIFGGISALSSMARNMSSADTLRTDVAAPRDLGQQYSRFMFAPLVSSDPTRGQHQTGSEAVDPTITWTRSNARSVESASQRAQTLTNDFRQMAGSVLAETFAEDQRAGHGVVSGQSNSSSRADSLSQTLSQGAALHQRLVDEAHLNSNAAWDLIGQAAAALKFGGEKPGLSGGIDGSLGTNLRFGSDVGQAQKESAERVLDQSFQEQPGLQASLSESLMRDVRDNSDRSWLHSSNQSEQKSLQRAASDALSATESYRSAVTSSLSSGSSSSIPAQAAVQAIRSSPAGREALAEAITKFGLGREVKRLDNLNYHAWNGRYGGADGVHIMAALTALGAYGQASNGQHSALRQAAVSGVFQKLFGDGPGVVAGAEANSGVAGDVRSPSASVGGGDIAATVRGSLSQGETAADANAVPQLRETFDRYKAANQGEAVEQARPLAHEIVAADKRDASTQGSNTSLEWTVGAYDAVTGAVSNAYSSVAHGARGHFDEWRRKHDELVSQAKEYGLTQAQADYFALKAGGEPPAPPGDHAHGNPAAWAPTARPDPSWSKAKVEMQVRSEAMTARLDPTDVLKRLDAAAFAHSEGSDRMRLVTLGRQNVEHELVPAPPLMAPTLQKALVREGRAETEQPGGHVRE